ncbi:hypothetical protein JMF97_06580 [Micromonospora fiedleri]|uniref:4-amino-4-deoxy-L-arabinose transferase n=1 Tax=Micromonospora fiedleri TaxID=1157498 RepID=A0ABS1UHK3_9ACTN|nr:MULTISPECIES: hypothetical protein [Micromonospora]MBL6275824.1 hypothetical protein [Micromonospora fiedleri]WSK41931.1 hypothetical protein OG712_26145 [Micromonospora maris]
MRGSRVVALAAACAGALGVAYLILPAMGSDLAAQVARADFFAAHGPTPVDLRWYGGVQQFGYSLLAQPVMALLGVRLTGVVALVAAATALAALLVRTRVPRPLLGSLVGVVTIAGNLISGRITYGLGVAFGLAALLALTWRSSGASSEPDGAAPVRSGRLPLVLAGVGALLASATSPVAGLFVGLAGVALLLSRRYADGLTLAVTAALPLAVTALLFGDGGWMNISRTDTIRATVTALLVAVLVGYRPVWVGALLAAAGVVAAALVHTPVGLNATRLASMFALPLLAAAAHRPAWLGSARRTGPPAAQPPPEPPALPPSVGAMPRRVGAVALAVLLAVVCWWQPPVVPADLRSIGDPTGDPGYYAPLRAEVERRGLTGRVEVPPTRNYWEAARLGEVPLARGWLRQADIDRNPLFFTTVPGATGTGVPLTVDSYRAWLDDNAVQYVAVPDAPLSWVGRAEAELVDGGLPYLTEVWSDRHWRLYAVSDPTPLVGAPGEVLHADGASVTFRTASAGTVPIRVRHSRWLTASDGATVAADEGWTVVTVPRAGTYTLGS